MAVAYRSSAIEAAATLRLTTRKHLWVSRHLIHCYHDNRTQGQNSKEAANVEKFSDKLQTDAMSQAQVTAKDTSFTIKLRFALGADVKQTSCSFTISSE